MKIEAFYQWLRDNSINDFGKSPLWDECATSFNSMQKTGGRGYVLNIEDPKKTSQYLVCARVVKKLCAVLDATSQNFSKLSHRALSKLIFGHSAASRAYGLDRYDPVDRPTSLVESFIERQSKNGIGMSHNSLKLFSYLEFLEKSEPALFTTSRIKVLEIGAGLFNFGHMLAAEVSEFEFIVCDLPELIPAAYEEITEKYTLTGVDRYDVFLPHELNRFFSSDSKRKLLFALPTQLDVIESTGWRFNLFVNHESFGEMPKDTVNGYLKNVHGLGAKGSTVFIVNRLLRIQETSQRLKSVTSLSEVTSFWDYELSNFDEKIVCIDPFRQSIERSNTEPNFMYVGRVSK